MIYTLKLFDTALLSFEVAENLADPVVNINWICESAHLSTPFFPNAD